jgi:hypothetical protein
MISLIYVILTIVAVMPYTFIMRLYSRRIEIESTVDELRDLMEKLNKISPEKEKKIRLLKARYDQLKKRISTLFIVNLVVIWMSIFTALSVSRIVAIFLASYFGFSYLIPSPLLLPGISANGYLNDLILLLAVLLAYQPFHNKLSGFSKIMELR